MIVLRRIPFGNNFTATLSGIPTTTYAKIKFGLGYNWEMQKELYAGDPEEQSLSSSSADNIKHDFSNVKVLSYFQENEDKDK